MRGLKRLFLSGLLLSVAGVHGAVRLQYLPEHPVLQTSDVKIELFDGQGRGEASASAQQTLQARLSLHPTRQQRVVIEAPYEMSFDLQRLSLGFDANGQKVQFDSEHPEGSSFMKEIAKAVGQPAEVSVGSDLTVTSESEEFKRLIVDLERVGGFNLNHLVSEMFQHIFALAGASIEVGSEFSQELALGADTSVPLIVTYKVVGITPSEVRAVVKGGFASTEIDATSSSLVDASKGPSTLTLSCAVEGKAVWSRHNALVYKTRIDYNYRGELVSAGQATPVVVSLRHQNSARSL